jgi:glycogen debranching enzyme
MMAHQLTEQSVDHGFVPHMNYFKGDGRQVPEWARKHFEDFLKGTDGRLVPDEEREEFLNSYWSHQTYSDITQPPILAMSVLEVHQADYHRGFAMEMIPRLKAFYDYLGRRRADKDGLLRIIHPWESGWDNSQRWDEVIGAEGVERFLIDRRKIRLMSKYKALHWDLDKIIDSRQFLVKPVDFNVLYAKNMECLSRLCELMGDRPGAAEYKERARLVADSIRSAMWDGDKYVDILQAPEGDRLSRVKSAAMFYPMMLAGEARSRHLIHHHLANPDEFSPPDGFMVSTTSLDDPSCDGSEYWRGNVWGIVNFFVHCGVREYLKTRPDDAVASAMAERIRESMFGLLDEAGFYEYFNTKKVDGEPRGYGVPSFGWNGLALFMDREPAFASLCQTMEIAESTES